jgi:hypothetical protein
LRREAGASRRVAPGRHSDASPRGCVAASIAGKWMTNRAKYDAHVSFTTVKPSDVKEWNSTAAPEAGVKLESDPLGCAEIPMNASTS